MCRDGYCFWDGDVEGTVNGAVTVAGIVAGEGECVDSDDPLTDTASGS